MKILKLFGFMFVVFLAVDAVWLGLVAPEFYKRHIGHLLAEEINWLAAAAFYLTFLGGHLYFVVRPGLHDRTSSPTVVRGVLFGLVTYATYDLTNMATLKEWPLIVTLADLAWGMFLCGVVGYAGHRFQRVLHPDVTV